jgi:hypothetical protein
LIEALRAVPLDDMPRLAPLAARLSRLAPQTVRANLLVAGDYTLELTVQERTVASPAGTPPRTYRAVMVESLPLPPQYQSHAQTSAAQ